MNEIMSKEQWAEAKARKEEAWREKGACEPENAPAVDPTVRRTVVALVAEIAALGAVVDMGWENHEKVVAALNEQVALYGLTEGLMDCLGGCITYVREVANYIGAVREKMGL